MTGAAPNDPYDLARFVEAQDAFQPRVLAELRRGRKESHWMWFVFPQAAGLGRSEMAARYAIGSLDEARAYLAHPVLGARLRECTALINAAGATDAEAIFGPVDALKFRSSMTLFALAAPEEDVFRQALATYFDGEPDPRTIELFGSFSRG